MPCGNRAVLCVWECKTIDFKIIAPAMADDFAKQVFNPGVLLPDP
jgi:hypothetical protein